MLPAELELSVALYGPDAMVLMAPIIWVNEQFISVPIAANTDTLT